MSFDPGGVRVGEASNPGPVQTRQARSGWKDQIQLFPGRGLGSTQVDSSSDEELLVRPNSGRDVVPRSGELVAHTPPGSSVVPNQRHSAQSQGGADLCGFGNYRPSIPGAAGMAVDDVPSAIVDALEMDLSPVSSTVPASVADVRRMGRATPHLRRVVLIPQSAGHTTVRPRCH